MKNTIAIIALMLIAACAEGPTYEPTGPDPPSKTAVDGNWEVTQSYFYNCNDTSCEGIWYPRANYGCVVKPIGFLNFTPMPGKLGMGTLVAEIFWTSSCEEFVQQDGMVTLASYSVYVDNGHLMMNVKSLDYGGWDYVVAIHGAGEKKLQMDFFNGDAYVFTFMVNYAGDVLECLYSQSPDTEEMYGYCYMDWHCDVLFASCIAKDDCAHVLDSYERHYGSWNLNNENECLELKIPEYLLMD